MPSNTINLGSSTVGVIGYGAMNLTWAAKVTSDDQAFETIKTAIDHGSTFINSGEFYGNPPNGTANLDLLSRFFARFPEYADRVVLSVKGGFNLATYEPDGSLEGLRKSVTNINEHLLASGGNKKMDLFEMARVDKSRPQEEVMQNMLKLVEEGHFKLIGLSECSAETIRKSAAVAPIAAVEVEYSPWSLDIEQNGVLATCKELGIPIVAYSPLGRGFLTGSIRSRSDLPPNDMRLHFDRFSEENFPKNLELVDQFAKIARKKGVESSQLALAWLRAQDPDLILPIPGSTRAAGVLESLGAINVSLTPEELAEIRATLDKFQVQGGRYNARLEGALEG